MDSLEKLKSSEAEMWLDAIRARKGELYDRWQSLPHKAAEVFLYYASINNCDVIRELLNLGILSQIYHPQFKLNLFCETIKNKAHDVLKILFEIEEIWNKYINYIYQIAGSEKNTWVQRFLLSLGYEYTGPTHVHFRIGDLDGRIRGELIKLLRPLRLKISIYALLEIYSYIHWPYLPRNRNGFGIRVLMMFSELA